MVCIFNFREDSNIEHTGRDTNFKLYDPSFPDSDIIEKAANFDSLMAMVKAKIHESEDKRTIIHLLTLPPSNWSKNSRIFRGNCLIE